MSPSLRFLLTQVKSFTKSFSRRLLWIFCPLYLGESFEEFASIVLLFPSLNEYRKMIVWVFILLMYFAFLIDALVYEIIDTHYLPLPRASFGPLSNPIRFMVIPLVGEAILIRSYFFYVKIWKEQDVIPWFKIVSKVSKKQHPKLFKMMKRTLIFLFFTILIVIILNSVYKLAFERSLALDYFVNVTYLCLELVLLRFAMLELPLIYFMAYSCYLFLSEKLDELTLQVTKDPARVDAIKKYNKLISSILQVNPLMRLISISNGLFIVPFVSLFIVLSLTETENKIQVIVKLLYSSPAFAYSIRGFIITAISSRMTSKSKIFYKLIACQIARGHPMTFVSHRQIIFILEDLASRKNRISFRKHSGSIVQQMDILVNIVTIVQFVMLIMAFSNNQ